MAILAIFKKERQTGDGSLLAVAPIDFRFSVKEALWDFTQRPGSRPRYVQLDFVS